MSVLEQSSLWTKVLLLFGQLPQRNDISTSERRVRWGLGQDGSQKMGEFRGKQQLLQVLGLRTATFWGSNSLISAGAWFLALAMVHQMPQATWQYGRRMRLPSWFSQPTCSLPVQERLIPDDISYNAAMASQVQPGVDDQLMAVGCVTG